MAYQSRLELQIDARTGERNLRSLEGQLNRTERSGQGLIGAMGGLGRVMGVVAAAAGGISFSRVITETASFEDSMLGLQAVSKATTGQMQQLEKQARTLGATSMFSAKQAGDAQRFLAQASFDVNEVLSATPGILRLASAGQMDLAQAADLASNALGGFGLSVDQLNRVNDVLAATAAGANTNVSQLGEALSYAAPFARAAGIEIEEAASAIGVMSDSGIQASRAGTGLVGVIRQLSNVTNGGRDVLAKYGLTVEDVNISTHGLSTVMQTLRDSGAIYDVGDAIALFGSEAGGAAQLLGVGSDRLREFTTELGNAEGEAERMALVISSGLTGSMRGFSSMVSETLISLGKDEGVAGAFQDVTDTATGVLAVYNDLLPEFAEANNLTDTQTRNIERLASGLSATTTVAAGAAGAFIAYRGAVVTATTAQWAFNAAVAANPLGAIVTLAGAAAGAMYLYRGELGLVDTAAQNANAALEANADAIRDGSAAALDANYDNLTNALEAVSLQAQEAMAQLTELTARQAFYENSHKGMAESVAGAIGDQEQALAGLWERQVQLQTAIRRNREERESMSSADRRATLIVKTLDEWMFKNTKTTEGAAAAAKGSAKEATSLADAYESLLDRITPNRREARQYARDLGVLNLALASGRMTTTQYMQAMGMLQESFQAAQRETENLSDTVSVEADAMGRSMQRFEDSIDSAFVDAFRGAFDSFKSFSDRLIDGFKNLLAELAYQALLKPIVVQFTQSMGGMLGIPGAGGQQGGGFDLSPGGISNAWNMVQNGFGGIQWTGASNTAYAGTGWANAATQGTGATGYLGGSSANFSGATGLASLGAGYAGSYAGTELGSSLFGRDPGSSYGAMAGGAIGTYLGGPVGAFLGSTLGGLADSLFGSGKKTYDFDFKQGQHSYVFGDRTSAFGDSGLTALSDYKLGEQQDALNDMLTAMAEFDNRIATTAIPERFEAMKEAIDGFTHSGAEDLFETRLREMITGGEVWAAEAVASITDPEKLAQGMLGALQLEQIGGRLGSELSAEIQAAISEARGDQAGDVINSTLADAQAAEFLHNSLERLNLQFDVTAQGALSAAGELSDYAGGVDNMAAIQQAYYNTAFSETERLSNAQADLYASLSSVTDQVPTTVEQLRAMVEAQDLNGEASAQLAYDLMALAPALKETNAAVRQSIEQQYQDVLGRTPDAAGLDYWFDQVASGALTLEAALEWIANSIEGAESQIRAAYEESLGREVGADGLAYWMGQVESGALTLEGALWNIANSAEAAEFAAGDAADAIDGASGALRDMEAVARERERLERQLLQLQGDTTELRRLDLATVDPANHALQRHVWAMQDQAAAASEAEQAAQALAQAESQIANERMGLERQMLQAMGDTAALRAMDLAQIDPSNRALQQRVWAIQDEQQAASDTSAEINRVRQALAQTSTASRGASDALRELQQRLNAAQNAAQQSWDRYRSQSLDLEMQLLEMVGDESAILALQRERELEAMDESLRPFQERLWALQDEAQAVENAREAAANYRGELERVRGDLSSAFGSISQWVDQLLATSQTPTLNLEEAGEQFARQLVLAEQGDRDALQSITRYAEQYLSAGEEMFASGSGFQQIQGDVLAALENLPDIVSAEQFLADEFRQALQDTVGALPGGIYQAIAPLYDEIDINADGLIDWDEFYGAFEGIASDAELGRIFEKLDADGSGTISELEAIKGFTDDTGENTKPLEERANDQITALGGLNSSMTGLADGMVNLSGNIGGLVNAIAQLADIQAEEIKQAQVESALNSSAQSGLQGLSGAVSGHLKSWQETPNPSDAFGYNSLSDYLAGYLGSSPVSIASKSVSAWDRLLPVDVDEGWLKDNPDFVPRKGGINPQWVHVPTFQDALSEYERLTGNSYTGQRYAKGGVFTNSIVDTPTYFNTALMGEAGPEAIMPLTRHSDGSLGVRAEMPMPQFPLLGQSDINETLRDLNRQVAGLRAENREMQRIIADNTGDTANAVADTGRQASQQREQLLDEQRAQTRATRLQKRGQTV